VSSGASGRRAGRSPPRGPREPRQKTRVDERHVAGDDGDVLARGGSTGVPNARDRSEVGLVVDRPAERKREAVERVSDRFSLIGPTIYHEFVDDRVAAGGAPGARRDGIVVAGQSVCDAADHRNPRKRGDGLVSVAEARRAPPARMAPVVTGRLSVPRDFAVAVGQAEWSSRQRPGWKPRAKRPVLDVVTREQARIAEDTGAVAVMALEAVPADIRKRGGVARMPDPENVTEIIDEVSIPVMGKSRIGHRKEAEILESLGVDMIDESEVLTPADDEYHTDKRDFASPFVCGARDLPRRSGASARARR